MKTSALRIVVSAAALISANALGLPCNDKGFEDTPFDFLVRLCESAEESKNFTRLLMSEVLDAEKAPNTHPVLEEYAVHFDKLNANFCNELKANNEASWKKVTKPEWFHPDDVYEILMCHRNVLQSYLDSHPPELQKLQEASLADLRWLIDNSERLHSASEKDFKNIE